MKTRQPPLMEDTKNLYSIVTDSIINNMRFYPLVQVLLTPTKTRDYSPQFKLKAVCNVSRHTD